jgi:hypothetical protein
VTPVAAPAHTWQSYRVELIGSGYPPWFNQLAVAGLRRTGPYEAADLVVQVEAQPPRVTWVDWKDADTSTSPLSMERRVPVLAGVGDHRCQVVAVDRLTGTVAASIELSVQDSAVRWIPPQTDYRLPTGLPVVLPEGRAWAWGQQAWAEAFARAEQQLTLRFGHPPTSP